jgi:hypothetical protein
VIGLNDRKTHDIAPALILDSKMWEITGYTDRRVTRSRVTHPMVAGPEPVGYPVLAWRINHEGSTREEAAEWLANTQLRMGDLLSPEGSEKRGVFPRWIVLRVVSGRDMLPDYEQAHQDRLAVVAERHAWGMRAAASWGGHVAAVEAVNGDILSLGLADPGEEGVVRPSGFGSTQVVLELALLQRLVSQSGRSPLRCAWCRVVARLVPYSVEGHKTELVCEACHRSGPEV